MSGPEFIGSNGLLAVRAGKIEVGHNVEQVLIAG
jgi:hypothetical protein